MVVLIPTMFISMGVVFFPNVGEDDTKCWVICLCILVDLGLFFNGLGNTLMGNIVGDPWGGYLLPGFWGMTTTLITSHSLIVQSFLYIKGLWAQYLNNSVHEGIVCVSEIGACAVLLFKMSRKVEVVRSGLG